MLDFVLLAGGNTLVKGFDARVRRELQMVSPVGQQINVVNALDAQLDAWRGGALFARNIVEQGSLQEYTISKAAYDECGHNYLKEHACSNFLYGQTKRAQNVEFNCQKRQRAK
jgi:actin-related protein 5